MLNSKHCSFYIICANLEQLLIHLSNRLDRFAFDSNNKMGAKARETANRPDSELAIPSLLAKHDPNPGNLDPRPYQIELFERAKLQNTIAVLDTGK